MSVATIYLDSLVLIIMNWLQKKGSCLGKEKSQHKSIHNNNSSMK